MGFNFDRTFVPPFPRLPVTMTLPENSMPIAHFLRVG